MATPRIAIVGAGMGGMAAAGTLRQAGVDVQVYEQAHQFGRIGAGIQMLPNSMKVLRGIGVEARLREVAFAPYSHLNRDGVTGVDEARIADAGGFVRRAVPVHAPRRPA